MPNRDFDYPWMVGFPVTLSALAIAFFFLPGVAFVAGLFANPTVNRDSSNLSAPITLAIVFFFACLINSLAGLAFWLNVCLFQKPGGLCGPYDATFVSGRTLGDALAMVSTFLALSFTGFFMGRKVTRLIEAGHIRTAVLHGWAYDYVRDPNPKTAFVLTTMGKDTIRVGYEGTLHSLRIASDGVVKTITLKNVRRFRVDFDKGREEGRTQIDDPDGGSWRDTDLVLEGSRIENVAIRSLPSLLFLEDVPDDEAD